MMPVKDYELCCDTEHQIKVINCRHIEYFIQIRRPTLKFANWSMKEITGTRSPVCPSIDKTTINGDKEVVQSVIYPPVGLSYISGHFGT